MPDGDRSTHRDCNRARYARCRHTVLCQRSPQDYGCHGLAAPTRHDPHRWRRGGLAECQSCRPRTDSGGALILAQFGFYLVVGGLSFFVDIGAFMGLRAVGMPLYLASIANFVLATIANYFLSYVLAFKRGRFARGSEIARLFAVAGVGLALNTGFVWLFLRSDL
ncbi:MAG: GtrA family protein, partial [Alphaproteobacteria bacterium]|nr:GtrA family protein [Alphaproteobacteria bacterium]